MKEVEFLWTHGVTGIFADARTVRRRVFCDEQGYSLIGEFDDKDTECLHIVGYAEGFGPVCTARMFEEEAGVYHIGRVAVLPQWRGNGTGREMMAKMAQRAAEKGASALVLNAQADKYTFYEKCGFVCTGKTLLDEGQPHVEMKRKLE